MFCKCRTQVLPTLRTLAHCENKICLRIIVKCIVLIVKLFYISGAVKDKFSVNSNLLYVWTFTHRESESTSIWYKPLNSTVVLYIFSEDTLWGQLTLPITAHVCELKFNFCHLLPPTAVFYDWLDFRLHVCSFLNLLGDAVRQNQVPKWVTMNECWRSTCV